MLTTCRNGNSQVDGKFFTCELIVSEVTNTAYVYRCRGTDMKTIYVKPKDLQRKWYVVDVEGKGLGRAAVKIASILRGKHKPEYVPHQEIGDYVIVVNAGKVALTGRKEEQKMYYRHSGYPGGLSGENFYKMVRRKPVYPMERAVWGMLPKGPLGRKLYKNLKVYAGADHPHAAQQPEQLEI